MKKKFIGFGALLALAGLTLASCGQSTRNSTTPYGDLQLDSVVATAKDNAYKMTTETYYNKLRYNGSTLVTDKIKEALYAKELAAIKDLFASNSIADLKAETVSLLIPTKDDKKLFTLDGTELLSESYLAAGCNNNYDVIKFTLENTVNANVSTSIFSTQSSESIESKTDVERNKAIKTFITTNARKGITIAATDLAFTYPADDSDFKIVKFTNVHDAKFADLVNPVLLSEAEKLSAQNALYQIADLEYIKAYNADEDDSETKNSNYIFKDTTIEDTYESSYQKFGTYHAVLIQFNSRKEAMDTINNLKANNGIDFKAIAANVSAKAKAYNEAAEADKDAKKAEYEAAIAEAKDAYKTLYNTYYAYKTVDSLDLDKFYYRNNLNKNDFSDLSEDITTLIQTTLEDNQLLAEPRNVSNKYVMALRLDTVYDVSGNSEEKKYANLSDDEKALYTTKIKYNTLIANASSYTSTNFKSMVYSRSNNDNKNDDIFIYDPIFEYKFYSSYSSDYTLIDKANFNNNLILKIDDYTYSVADFYKEASKTYSNSIITNYFELEYAYTYYDDYVDSDTHDSNVETLTTAINDFNAGKNSSYDKELGEANYLLLNYGYTKKDDIIKYYYDAQTCLTSYNSKKVFESWAKATDTGYTYADNLDTAGTLFNILTEGNKTYTDLFSINLDHFLINIDDDGDGSPDEPKKFLSKMSTDAEREDFKNAVVELARALYTEASNAAYEDNSLYKILTFIKSQYEEGATLKSDPTKTWDDYKKYNFLITVEQLASSGDITQSSVSNFVTPFADYVKGVFATCVDSNNSISTSYSNGKFIYYDTVNKTGNLITSADQITMDTLCETVYGYHVLILNSYSKAKETKYTSSDDSSGVQKAIQLLIKEDSDNSDNNIYITIDSYNEETNKVSFNQFLIYYIQKANGVESSLSSNISTLLSSMYDNIISTYTSSNFQNVLLLDLLNIKSDDATIQATVTAERSYYANLVCDYADNNDPKNNGSIYYSWVFDAEGKPNTTSWVRPEK